MKTFKTSFACIISACTLLAVSFHASAQDKANAAPLTIVMPITSKDGKAKGESFKLIQSIAAIVRTQPGLIDEVLMENKSGVGKPTFVHVMRWKEMKDFEAMMSNKEFQKAISANNGKFTLDTAQFYVPVK